MTTRRGTLVRQEREEKCSHAAVDLSVLIDDQEKKKSLRSRFWHPVEIHLVSYCSVMPSNLFSLLTLS